ncbi:MAG TPA: alpha/beta fold hydrolase, partial [Burkholderiales bacterium]|nr:alpha/beta fold hydrolase [Burkholderiales bacterium]
FGSGGIQYAHPKLEHNLVRFLAEKEFDVWVGELRTSIALDSSRAQWTLDDVALNDVPAIVDRVLEITGREQVDVVAHCIGSAMFCTAALAGKLTARGHSKASPQSKIRAAVLLQVGPLISLSKGNLLRGYLAAALRRYVQADFVEGSVDSSAKWMDVVLDRLLWTYPYPPSEQPAHALPGLRMPTHIANCNRLAGMFGRLFQHENLDDTTLDCLGDLLGHTNITTFEQMVQYAFVKRLTDHDACNAYATDENVKAYFHFPVRFIHGEENDVFHERTVIRSLQLLNDVFGKNPNIRDRVEIEKYGHLDPVIGKNACEDVYPKIGEFLVADRKALTGALPKQLYYVKPPLIGPVLGYLRREEGRWLARIWCRTNDQQSYADFLMAVVFDEATHTPVRDFCFRADLKGNGGRLDQLVVLDVPVPDGAKDYEIAILGAYRSAHCNVIDDDFRGELNVSGPPAGDAKVVVPGRGARVATLELPAEYADEVQKLWNGAWRTRHKRDTPPRRVCDDGYEDAVDSVILSKYLVAKPDPSKPEQSMSFAVASCRYAASLIDRERADASFGRLCDLLETNDAPSLLLLCGDQIYADASAGLFDAKTRRARFYDAYRETWTAPNAREVFRRLPTYMMLDDHEIDDNWHPVDPLDETMKGWGLRAFEEYQLMHSPRELEPAVMSREHAYPGQMPYHYHFESAGFPFFVCDT